MPNPAEIASIIGPECLKLRKLALDAKLDLLAHLLEMASLESAHRQLDEFRAACELEGREPVSESLKR